MIPMYFVGPSSKASQYGWNHGPAGYAYRYQDAREDEIEMAKDAGWRETLTEAIEAYEGVLLEPATEPPAEIVKRGPGRPRKEQP